MSMKITRLQNHWSTAEAWTVIEMLDRLRDALWDDYGDQVTQMMWDELANENDNKLQQEIDFNDEIPF